jgi:hypothetical protein
MSRGYWICAHCGEPVCFDDDEDEEHECHDERFYWACAAMRRFLVWVALEVEFQGSRHESRADVFVWALAAGRLRITWSD